MKPRKTFKPGEEVKTSGQYIKVGPRGGITGQKEITGVKGKKFPPTTGQGFILADKTKHKKKS